MFQNKVLNNKLIRQNNITSGVLNSNKNIIQNKKPNSNLYTKEYEINDVRISVRNILTKGQTHDEISQYSGASVSTRGRYISPVEKSRGLVHDRPLYLFIQGNAKSDIDLAVHKIDEIIQRESGGGPIGGMPGMQPGNNNNLNMMSKFNKYPMNRNQPPPPPPPPSSHNLMAGAQQQHPDNNGPVILEKLIIGLDHAPEAFDLKGHVLGTGGANLHYIRNETGAMATLRGKGSGFIEGYGFEANEPMHLYIEHTNLNGLQFAKQLVKNLIDTIQQELVQFQQANPPIPANIQLQANQPTTIIQSELFAQQQQQPPPPQQQQQISLLTTVPPPIVNGIMQQPPPQTILQQAQPNFIQQNHQQQTILPIQIHHQPGGNMMIQQQQQSQQQQPQSIEQQVVNPIGNLSVPPPGIHHVPVKGGQLVQIQSAAPHLSHPPPNIQLQAQPQPTQILFNQAPPNYQFQYVQQHSQQPQPTNTVDQQAQQVTIQHIYQTPQGLVQTSSAMPPQFEQIQVRAGQQIQTTQQYIALPGQTTAFMVPPPNIIQTQQRPAVQNIIYTSQPQQIHYSMASGDLQLSNVTTTMAQTTPTLVGDETTKKLEIKCDDSFSPNKKPPPKSQSPQQQQTHISIPFTQLPPPQIPPPNIQQIVEQQQQTICHQVPVSLGQHQIHLAPNQSITTNAGYILNAPQWTTTTQQPPPIHQHHPHQQNSQIIHLTTQQPPPQHPPPNFFGGNEQPPPPPQHQQQHFQNQQMHIQFHQAGAGPPPQVPAPIIHHMNIEQHQQQPQFGPPPRFHLQTTQHNYHLIDVGNGGKLNQPRILHQIDTTAGGQQGGIVGQQHIVVTQQQIGSPQQNVTHHQQQQQQVGGGENFLKQNRKRKSENEGDAPPTSAPKIGMGLLLNERDPNSRMVVADHPPPPSSVISSSNNTSTPPTVTTTTTPTTSNQNRTDLSSNSLTDESHENRSTPNGPVTQQQPPKQQQQQQQQSGGDDNRSNESQKKNMYYDGRQLPPPPPPPHSRSSGARDPGGYRHQMNRPNGPFMMGGGNGSQQMDDNRRYNLKTLGPPPYSHRGGLGGNARFRGQW